MTPSLVATRDRDGETRPILRQLSGILYSLHITHRLPELFPDPTTFKPGRWIEGRPDHHAVLPYACVPFGGGGRRCIGFAFAHQELAVMISALGHERADRT